MEDSEILKILSFIKHPIYRWSLGIQNDLRFIQVHFERLDAYNGATGTGHGRKWMLSEDPTESEIVFTCVAAGLMMQEHEFREAFSYEGRRVISPHTPIGKLWEASKNVGT